MPLLQYVSSPDTFSPRVGSPLTKIQFCIESFSVWWGHQPGNRIMGTWRSNALLNFLQVKTPTNAGLLQLCTLMKNKIVFIYLFVVSIALSILGFLVDSDPRPANISTPIFEIFAMSLILFVFLALLYFGFKSIFGQVKRLRA